VSLVFFAILYSATGTLTFGMVMAVLINMYIYMLSVNLFLCVFHLVKENEFEDIDTPFKTKFAKAFMTMLDMKAYTTVPLMFLFLVLSAIF